MGERVFDRVAGDYGTVVADLGKGRYRVAWDNPSPHQDTAAPRIPSEFFTFA